MINQCLLNNESVRNPLASIGGTDIDIENASASTGEARSLMSENASK